MRGYLDYLAMVQDQAGTGHCLFATAPDIFGDVKATLERSLPTLELIRDAGFPAALVAQDGLTPEMVPWNELDCLFIGGTNEFKFSDGLRTLVEAAKENGKWVHNGRVNSWKRIAYSHQIGCDSVDGTYVRYGPSTNYPRFKTWIERLHNMKGTA